MSWSFSFTARNREHVKKLLAKHAERAPASVHAFIMEAVEALPEDMAVQIESAGHLRSDPKFDMGQSNIKMLVHPIIFSS